MENFKLDVDVVDNKLTISVEGDWHLAGDLLVAKINKPLVTKFWEFARPLIEMTLEQATADAE